MRDKGTADVSITAELIIPVQQGGRFGLMILWDQTATLATEKKFRLRKNAVNLVNKKLAEFFKKMENEIRAARKREAG